MPAFGNKAGSIGVAVFLDSEQVIDSSAWMFAEAIGSLRINQKKWMVMDRPPTFRSDTQGRVFMFFNGMTAHQPCALARIVTRVSILLGSGLLFAACPGPFGFNSTALAVTNEPQASENGASATTVADQPTPEVALLYFTQAECPPCRQMQPMLDHLIGRGFPIHVVDVHQHPTLVQQFEIATTPTFVLLKDRQELKRHSGVLSSYQVNSLLIDAGYPTDQNVLTKPNALSPIVNFFDRLRPIAKSNAGENRPLARLAAFAANEADPTASIPSSQLSVAEQRALQATGRLKVQYQDGGQSVTDYGTATVIHRQGADILLLTCGHVFRDSRGQGNILVELDFSNGQPQDIVPGQLLMFDAGAPDLALVAAKTRLPIEPMPIHRSDFVPQQGDNSFSVGCDLGAPATVRRGQHLNVVRCGAVQIPGEATDDRMARKFAVHGRPVVGRSGGGLFTTDGHLIGVCNAAVMESNEGRYSAIDNIHDMLVQTNLQKLFLSPPSVDHATTLADNRAAQSERALESTRRRPRFLPLLETAPVEMAAGQPMPPRQSQSLGQSPR